MATVSAADPPATRSRPDPTRRLWQVPAFILGLAAFASAYMGWLPIGPPDPASAFRRDLAALRAATEKLTPDAGELKVHLNRVAGTAAAFPEHGPASHFVLGSGYIRLAELTGDLNEAKNWWVLAGQHFASVRPDQVDVADQPRLAYRAAKTRAIVLAPDTPTAEIDQLRNLLLYTPAGEDPGDAPRLVAELSLRTNPLDLQRAKESLTAYISETGLATPSASIARAKLRLSQVHLELSDPDGAKKWLAQIGSDAPPDVLPTAKAQLARIRMAEADYGGAAREWEQVRGAADLPPGLRGAAAYHLGVCRILSRPPDADAAVRLFAEAAKGDTPEAAAASIRLAEIQLRQPDAAKHLEAAKHLAAGVKGVSTPTEYSNALLPLSEVQAAFELAVQVLVADAAFEPAVNAAEAYLAVAVAGRDREKRAETLAAWGTSLQKGGTGGAAKFAQAADEYLTLAGLRSADTDRAEQYRRAAGLYRQAGKPEAALAACEQVLKLKLPDDVSGPVWVEYAEGLLAANRPDDALKAFKTAMVSSSPSSTIARHRLARLLLDTRDPRKVPLGIAMLEQIAAAERVSPAEQDAHERALLELAHEYIRAGKFADSEARLRTQLSRYPTGAESGLAKLLLGVCLLQRADPKANPPVADPAKAIDEALKLFEALVVETTERQKAGKAADRDEWLRVQARLRVLQVYQQTARPNDILASGDKLRWEVAGTADELIVLNLMYHAYKQLNKPEGMLTIRDQMREVFEKLKAKPGAFWAKSGEYSREYWETVWFAPEAK